MTLVLRDVADGIAWITLNRPERMNAINVALSGELEKAIVELGNDPNVTVVVIRGAEGNFCAGGDFDEVELLRGKGSDALRQLFAAFRSACEAIARVEVPVVTAVEGVATAGGFELMQASDIALVSEDAKIADNHIRFGMIRSGWLGWSAVSRHWVCCCPATGSPAPTRCASAWHIAVFPSRSSMTACDGSPPIWLGAGATLSLR